MFREVERITKHIANAYRHMCWARAIDTIPCIRTRNRCCDTSTSFATVCQWYLKQPCDTCWHAQHISVSNCQWHKLVRSAPVLIYFAGAKDVIECKVIGSERVIACKGHRTQNIRFSIHDYDDENVSYLHVESSRQISAFMWHAGIVAE